MTFETLNTIGRAEIALNTIAGMLRARAMSAAQLWQQFESEIHRAALPATHLSLITMAFQCAAVASSREEAADCVSAVEEALGALRREDLADIAA